MNYDVVIIGAGVIGCSIALSLSRAGLSTLNIDGNRAPGYGSTSHSSAIIRPFYSHITSCAVAHESRHRWLAWENHVGRNDPSGLALYSETGGTVLVSSTDPNQFSQNLSVLEEVGITHEWLDSKALLQRHPGLSLDKFGPPKLLSDPTFAEVTPGTIIGGIHIPACGHVSDPQLATHNLFVAAKAAGAEFRFGHKVVAAMYETTTSNRLVGVTLDDAMQLHAQCIVNAAGPHSAQINTIINASGVGGIQTRPHRHEVAYLKATKDMQTHPGFLVDLDAGVYLRQDGADLLIGSADPECDKADIVGPDTYNESFTEQWTTQAYRAAQRIPALGIESKARGTVGLYDVSDDWIPIYDKTDTPGYYVAIGTSGNQFKNAPLVGDIMCAIIGQELNGLDHDEQPAKLHLTELNRQIDLSFYSRRRSVQTTGNVLA